MTTTHVKNKVSPEQWARMFVEGFRLKSSINTSRLRIFKQGSVAAADIDNPVPR